MTKTGHTLCFIGQAVGIAIATVGMIQLLPPKVEKFEKIGDRYEACIVELSAVSDLEYSVSLCRALRSDMKRLKASGW